MQAKIIFDFLDVAKRYSYDECLEAVKYSFESVGAEIQKMDIDSVNARITVMFENASINNLCLGVKRKLRLEKHPDYTQVFDWKNDIVSCLIPPSRNGWKGCFEAKIT